MAPITAAYFFQLDFFVVCRRACCIFLYVAQSLLGMFMQL